MKIQKLQISKDKIDINLNKLLNLLTNNKNSKNLNIDLLQLDCIFLKNRLILFKNK
jgi:hypothetical protein